MRSFTLFALALASTVLAAPVDLAERTSSTCWPSCSPSNPNPAAIGGLGLALQVTLWSTVNVPAIIAQLNAAVSSGNAASCSNAQTSLLNLQALIEASVKVATGVTASSCNSLIVKLKSANQVLIDADIAALALVDASVTAIANLEAAIAANAVVDLSAAISAVVKLRADLALKLQLVVGATQDKCNSAISSIDIKIQLCANIATSVSAQLDAAVRANVDADIKIALQLVAQLRAALQIGVNAGGAFGQTCSSALVDLDAKVKVSLQLIVNGAAAAVAGTVTATIQAAADILVVAKACVDVKADIFVTLTGALSSCQRSLGCSTC